MLFLGGAPFWAMPKSCGGTFLQQIDWPGLRPDCHSLICAFLAALFWYRRLFIESACHGKATLELLVFVCLHHQTRGDTLLLSCYYPVNTSLSEQILQRILLRVRHMLRSAQVRRTVAKATPCFWASERHWKWGAQVLDEVWLMKNAGRLVTGRSGSLSFYPICFEHLALHIEPYPLALQAQPQQSRSNKER